MEETGKSNEKVINKLTFFQVIITNIITAIVSISIALINSKSDDKKIDEKVDSKLETMKLNIQQISTNVSTQSNDIKQLNSTMQTIRSLNQTNKNGINMGGSQYNNPTPK